jgi:NAD(P)-dependent dehydrogenase (short-subunit alcohol dehydrogenase family)
MRYEGKVALVTAGASGIGLATVERLVSEGATVAFCDVAEERGRAVEQRLTKAERPVIFIPCDVTSETQVADLVGETVKRFGRIDVAMNVVGGGDLAGERGLPLHLCSLQGWESAIRVSATSTFLCMKHEILAMLQTGGGAIGNVSSMVGVRTSPHTTPGYAMAKAGVVHLTRMAAIRYARDNIRVNVIAPGLTSSPAALSLPGNQLAAMAEEFHPTGRVTTPQSQAAALVWVCSDDARDITGLTIPVDGGWAAT